MSGCFYSSYDCDEERGTALQGEFTRCRWRVCGLSEEVYELACYMLYILVSEDADDGVVAQRQ